MKIGILQTGRSPENIRQQFGDYDTRFTCMLDGHGFKFATYPVLDGIFPTSVSDADGWLITGSRFGAYEKHEWIPPLEDFLRRSFTAAVPIVGICFGHQILAQALGGKVEKFKGGWSVGRKSYLGLDGQENHIIAWHQDQVVEVPAGAEVTGSSEFCQVAMLRYGDRAMSLQSHPEFTPDFFTALLKSRRASLPDHIAGGALDNLQEPLTSGEYANSIATFFKENRLS